MKIVFDSEDQKETFLSLITLTALCPEDILLKNRKCDKLCDNFKECRNCWKQSGLEMEVNDHR